MTKNNILVFDNFLDNVDLIREDALLLSYTKSTPNTMGWKGYRCLYTNEVGVELSNIIMNKLIDTNPLFKDSSLRCYFHYTLKEDGLNKQNIHKDFDVDYAGVLYLTPNPSPNSGTSFYDDLSNETDYVENIYNRFVFYPSNEWHSLKDSFGDNINNGRLTFTVFCTLKKKEIESLI